MKECKYRLPCNWCDKLNKYCDITEPIKIELPNPDSCNHDWELECRYTNLSEDNRNYYYRYKYVCRKCYEVKITDDIISEYKN